MHDADKARNGNGSGGASAVAECQLDQLACPFCATVENVGSLAWMSNTVHFHEAITPESLEGWYYCASCEIVYQSPLRLAPAQTRYDDAYHSQFAHMGRLVLNQATYFLPVMERCTTGRSLLDVGDSQPFLAASALARGWFPTQCDINPAVSRSHFPSIVADFETYIFGTQYDAVWAAHVFEHFIRPREALAKVYDILRPNGCAYISAPDPFFLMQRFNWGHLHKAEHHIMCTLQCFKKLAEGLGFKVVHEGRMKHQNIFPTWYDFHLVLQKSGTNGRIILAS